MKWFAAYIATALVLTVQAHSRPPIPPAQFKAVRAQWKTRAERVRVFRIAWCESRFKAREVSPTGDYGFMAINRVAHDSWVDFGPRIFNPFYNAFVARRLYDASGWLPWENSRSCWA